MKIVHIISSVLNGILYQAVYFSWNFPQTAFQFFQRELCLLLGYAKLWTLVSGEVILFLPSFPLWSPEGGGGYCQCLGNLDNLNITKGIVWFCVLQTWITDLPTASLSSIPHRLPKELADKPPARISVPLSWVKCVLYCKQSINKLLISSSSLESIISVFSPHSPPAQPCIEIPLYFTDFVPGVFG